MSTHMTTPPEVGWVDKRKSSTGGSVADSDSHNVGSVIFTANGAGTTTTIVGADATLADGTNVVRVGEKVKVFNSDGTVQEEKILTVSSVASATGTTTVTFTPALTSATASGDVLRLVGSVAWPYVDNDSLDDRLIALGYSQATVDTMTQNDKVYAVRLGNDPTGF